MEITELLPRLHQVHLDFGQVYLWRDGDELTLVDTGIPGSGAAIAAAVESLGLPRRPQWTWNDRRRGALLRRPVGQRPLIELEPIGHPLAVEQRTGSTMARIKEIAEHLLH